MQTLCAGSFSNFELAQSIQQRLFKTWCLAYQQFLTTLESKALRVQADPLPLQDLLAEIKKQKPLIES